MENLNDNNGLIIRKIQKMLLPHKNLTEEQLFYVLCQLEQVESIDFTLYPDKWNGGVGNDNYLLYFEVYHSASDDTKMLMLYTRLVDSYCRFYFPVDDYGVGYFEDFIVSYGEK